MPAKKQARVWVARCAPDEIRRVYSPSSRRPISIAACTPSGLRTSPSASVCRLSSTVLAIASAAFRAVGHDPAPEALGAPDAGPQTFQLEYLGLVNEEVHFRIHSSSRTTRRQPARPP